MQNDKSKKGQQRPADGSRPAQKGAPHPHQQEAMQSSGNQQQGGAGNPGQQQNGERSSQNDRRGRSDDAGFGSRR